MDKTSRGFTDGLSGMYQLEEYYKSMYEVHLIDPSSRKMSFTAAVTFLMDNLPPLCKSCENIRCYVDDDTQEIICIFQKDRTIRERIDELNR